MALAKYVASLRSGVFRMKVEFYCLNQFLDLAGSTYLAFLGVVLASRGSALTASTCQNAALSCPNRLCDPISVRDF